jgi:ABC-type antimicrobial peptide transport system permease subunit
MKYFRNADLGFNQQEILMIPMGSHDEKTKTLKQQFLQLPDVQNVTQCFSAPASNASWGTSIRFDSRDENEDFSTQFKGGDEDFIATFGLTLIAGRNLLPADTVREIIVNETMVEKLGETPEGILGKPLTFNGNVKGAVVGVVKDFHDRSLHNDISPIFITTYSENFHAYAVKINMSDLKNTLASLEKTWLTMYPDLLYTHTFLEEETAEFYAAEETMMSVVEIFSFIALFIGCLGLYGLVSFMSVQKTKEIGIRKVLGGSLQHILWIFGREFTQLIFVAFVVAAPVAWMLMSTWLSNFEYKIPLSPWIFAADLAVIGFVALVTVGFRSARAALMNPVNALRSE